MMITDNLKNQSSHLNSLFNQKLFKLQLSRPSFFNTIYVDRLINKDESFYLEQYQIYLT